MLYEALRLTQYASRTKYEKSVANTLKSLGYQEKCSDWLASWWNGYDIDAAGIMSEMKEEFAEGKRELSSCRKSLTNQRRWWLEFMGSASDGNHSGKAFVPHPFGKNSCPDFILVNDNKVLPLEVKTTDKAQTHAPTFGTTPPSADYLYLFARPGRDGDQMLFMGDDITTEYQREIIESCKAEVRRIITEARRKLNENENLHGITVNGTVKVNQQSSQQLRSNWRALPGGQQWYHKNDFHDHERADFLRENAKAHINQFEAGKTE